MPQLVSLYLGCSWAVLQFVDWLVKRYLLSSHLTDAVLVILATLIPAVCLLAYSHGAPGKDRWGRLEKVGLPANVLVTVSLVVFLFAGKDLGAASRTVTTVDEEGRQVERQVPKEEARRRAGLFFFDSAESGEENRWLRYGVPILLAADLNQDPFVLASTPMSGWQGSFLGRLQRAGFQDGLEVPRSLMRHVTEQQHLPRFVAGHVERRGESYEIGLELYDVGTSDPLASTSVHGEDLLALVDDLAVWLKDALDVHDGGSRLADDLPVADRFSESVEAVRRYIEGQIAVTLSNDHATATEHYRRAVDLDPTFAAAHLALAQVYSQNADTEEAKASIQAALRHEYKLTERQTLNAKGWKYFLDGEIAKRAALYEMWTDLYPEDVEAHVTLAFVYMWTGNRVEDAIAAFERALELDPSEDWILRQLADLRTTRGDYEAALELHRRYAELHPDDHATSYHVGQVHQQAGDLEAAREHFEKAHLLLSGLVSPTLALADLEMREGHLDEAIQRLDEASATATTPRQKGLVMRQRIALLHVTGQLRSALDLMPELLELEQQFRQPLDVGILRMAKAELYVEAGRAEEMEEILDGYAALFKPPFDRFLHLGRMLLEVGRGDAQAIEHHRERLETLLREWERDDMLYLPQRAHGRALELQGEADAAIEAYRQALESHDRSTSQSFDPLLAERVLTRLARLERQRGDLAAAESYLDDALTLFPAYPAANLERARLLRQKGQEPRGRAHVERARDMLRDADPGFALADEVRADDL